MTRRPVAIPAAALAGASASAILYAAAYPPYSLWPAAWVSLVPILLVARSASAAVAYGYSAAFAVGACALCIGWIAPAAATYYQQPLAAGMAVFLGIALLQVVPPVLGFTWLYRRYVRLRPDFVAPLAAGAWVASELARSKLLTGNPFALIAYSQSQNPQLLQTAEFAGVYGVSFAMAAFNVGIAEAIAGAWTARRASPALRHLVIPVAIAAAVFTYGAWRIERGIGDTTKHDVLIVQGNLDLGAQWQPHLYGRNLDLYLKETLAGLDPEIDLVVWPENAMTFFVDREPLYRESIGSVLRRGNAELLAGGPRAESNEHDTFFNTAFLLAPDGAVRGHYDKRQLLPFAEYWPLPRFNPLARDFGEVREFSPGTASEPLAASAGRLGVLICNEAMFPELAAATVDSGAEILVNLTNDTWIGDPRYGVMAAEMTIFRAIEQRRWLVRSSTSGPSMIIDSFGRVTAKTQASVRTTLRGSVARSTEKTPYSQYGDVFAWLCAIVAIAGASRRRSGRVASGAGSTGGPV